MRKRKRRVNRRFLALCCFLESYGHDPDGHDESCPESRKIKLEKKDSERGRRERDFNSG